MQSSSDESDFSGSSLNDDLEGARLPSDAEEEYTYIPLSAWEKAKMVNITSSNNFVSTLLKICPQTCYGDEFQRAQRILPHVGLVLLLVCYLLVGAAVFQRIEGPNEVVVCSSYATSSSADKFG